MVRTVRVVVKGVATKDALEMPFVHNQEVIQALRSHGAHDLWVPKMPSKGITLPVRIRG